MHILILGDVGVGKSTLIRRLVEDTGKTPYGFLTEKHRREPGEDARVYIHSPGKEKSYTEANCVGRCGEAVPVGFPEVFVSAGVPMLSGIPSGSLVVMDELGVMESGAEAFCRAVLDVLDGEYLVLAAVKNKDTPFLRQVLTHPRARVYRITPENREALYYKIKEDLREEARGGPGQEG